MSNLPPPLPSDKTTIFHQLARVSWASVLLSVVINLLLVVSGARSPSTPLVAAIIAGSLGVIGIVSGLVALSGIFWHGRRGLLWPGLTGLVLWLLLVGLGIPGFMAARRRAQLERPVTLGASRHAADALQVVDSAVGYSFDQPAGYQPFPETQKPAGCTHALIKEVPGELNRVIVVRNLGQVIGRRRLKPEELPAGKATLESFHWRGVPIDGTRVQEKLGAADYVTFNALVPLKQQGVTIGFGGPAAAEAQLKALAEEVLATLEGETSW